MGYDEIVKALEINPNAHFGREKYLMRALEWIVDPPKVKESQYLPNLLGWSFDDLYGQQTDPKEADDAVRGLAGMIVLGIAWDSADIFHALNVALQRDSLGFERGRDGSRNTLAYLAWLRCRELVDVGKGSMLPDAPKGEMLKSWLPRHDFVKADVLLDSAFLNLRAEADAWHTARSAFMTKRLKKGRHPDTYPSFWDESTERPAPGLPTKSVPDAYNASQVSRQSMVLLVVVGVAMLVAGLVAGLLAACSAKARWRELICRKSPLQNRRAELVEG